MRCLLSILLLTVLPGLVQAEVSRGQFNYIMQCQGCHRADGSGLSAEVPDLRLYLKDYLQIPGGRAYMAQVPGSANAPLSSAELAEVLNWIATSLPGLDPPENFKPYTEQEIAAYKKTTLENVELERDRLLATIAAKNAIK